MASEVTDKLVGAIKSHPRYIGKKSASDAESLLKTIGGDHYFIHYCDQDQSYVISGVLYAVITHAKIILNVTKKYYKLDLEPGKEMKNMSELVECYEKCRKTKGADLLHHFLRNSYTPQGPPPPSTLRPWSSDILQQYFNAEPGLLGEVDNYHPGAAEAHVGFYPDVGEDPEPHGHKMAWVQGPLKIATKGPKETCSPSARLFKAERTKLLEAISDHPSYHGAISWSEAETKLKAHGGNCYLTRYTTGRKEYVLSVLNEGAEGDEFRHYNLVIGNDTYEIQGAEKKFSSIFDLLNFYQTVPVDHKVSTIGVCLKCTKKSTNYDPIRPLPPSPRIGYPSELHTYSKVQCQDTSDGYSLLKSETATATVTKRPSISLSSLTLMKWTDQHNNRQTLRLINEFSPQWETVGILLGLGVPKLNNLQTSPADNIRSCRKVFEEWLTNGGHPDYPMTWDGVCELLSDVQKAEVAKKLKEVLKCSVLQ